jgi:hypothetical protein
MEARYPRAKAIASLTFIEAVLPKITLKFLRQFETLIGFHDKMCVKGGE